MRSYELSIVIRPAEDLEGQWVAHCLDFDVVSQGNSLPHAIEMVSEAVAMTLADDRESGRDPFSRRAPDEFWAELHG